MHVIVPVLMMINRGGDKSVTRTPLSQKTLVKPDGKREKPLNSNADLSAAKPDPCPHGPLYCPAAKASPLARNSPVS